MANGFRLSDLVPEPLTFTDDMPGGDGITYDVLTMDLLSEHAIARMVQLQQRMTVALANQRGAEGLQAINDLLHLLIPGLPTERLSAIPVAYKTKFLEWYGQQQPATAPKATGPAPTTPLPPGLPLRDSSQPTASAPSS